MTDQAIPKGAMDAMEEIRCRLAARGYDISPAEISDAYDEATWPIVAAIIAAHTIDPAEHEKFRIALIDILNEMGGGHGLADTPMGRVNRIAHDVLGQRSLEQAEAMMQHPTELERVVEQRDGLLAACKEVVAAGDEESIRRHRAVGCGKLGVFLTCSQLQQILAAIAAAEKDTAHAADQPTK